MCLTKMLIAVSTQYVLATTCPGFPGYCSESFVGQTCVVVCAKGRPNVPLCQVSYILSGIYNCIVFYIQYKVIYKFLRI